MCKPKDCSTGECIRLAYTVHRNKAAFSTLLHLQVSVLADTSYNSLSVDEVAAQHAQADCVVKRLLPLLRVCLSYTYHIWAQ